MIIELRDRRGRLLTRERVAALPVTIGRAPSADIFVDDDTVDGEHVRVESIASRTDRWAVIDLESVNGLRVKRSERVARAELLSGDVARLGRTRLRLFADNHEVPAARTVRRRRMLSHPTISLLFPALVLLCSALDGYFEASAELESQALLASSLVLIALLASWAGLWAFAGRALVGETRFLEHFGIASLVVAANWITIWIAGYAQFLWLPSAGITAAATGLADAVLSTLGLAAHLALVSSMTKSRRRTAAAIISFGLIGMTQVSDWADEGIFSGNLSFPGELKPLPVSLLTVESPDAYFTRLDTLQTEIDNSAKDAAEKTAD